MRQKSHESSVPSRLNFLVKTVGEWGSGDLGAFVRESFRLCLNRRGQSIFTGLQLPIAAAIPFVD